MKYVAYLRCKLKNPWSPGVHHRQQAQSDEHASASLAVSIFRLSAAFIKGAPVLKMFMRRSCLLTRAARRVSGFGREAGPPGPQAPPCRHRQPVKEWRAPAERLITDDEAASDGPA